MAKKSPASSKKTKRHVSVIYFHGMGSQRRYEETSRLIDTMDAWLSSSLLNRGQDRGRFVAIKPKSELHHKNPGQTVTYIDTGYLAAGAAKGQQRDEVRFYEVYWAPIMAGSSSPKRVAIWIVSQVVRPFITLFTPWRERQRLHRAALADLRERSDKWPAGTRDEDFDNLVRLYAGFENLDRTRTYPTGNYEEFLKYLDTESGAPPIETKRLTALTDKWFRWYRFVELRNAFILATILLALILAGGTLIWFTLQLMQVLSGLPIFEADAFPFGSAIEKWIDPSWSTAAGTLVMLLLTVGLGKFLTDYMGDVEAWATYEETDEKNIKRRRVIDMGIDLIGHVLADPECERVVMVSHSLGTTVAHDTVLAVTRQNQAINPQDPISGPMDLTKLRHFVTIASPIDKINYFFESFRSKYHRYTRVVETLRGDLGTPPFSRNDKPYIHWVNYYDEADLIAGGLHSPVSRENMAHRVDNVHVSNLYFPAPGRAHSAYFENRRVISEVFEMIYEGNYNYGKLPLLPNNGGYDYESAARAPGDKRGGALKYHAMAAIIPWTGLFALVLYLLSLSGPATVLVWIVVVLIVVLVGSWLFSKGKGNRMPL